MKYGDIFRTSLSNLTRRKVRTSLTALGVTVGIFTIVVMLSLGVGVQNEIQKQFDAIGLENIIVEPENVERTGATRYLRPQREVPITPELIAEWRALPDVVSVIPVVDVNESINKRLRLPGDDTTTAPVNIDLGVGITNPFAAPPAPLAGVLRPEQNGQIVLSQRMAAQLKLTGDPASYIGKPVQMVLESPRGETQAFDYTIAGITNNSERRLVALTPDDSIALKAWWFNDPNLLATEGYDFAMIKGKDLTVARALVTKIEAQGFEVQSLETVLDLASQIFLVINIMLGSVGGLALFVATIGIMNTMIMAIYERTREIGTLKAIGASRGNIRTLFMTEAGMLGLFGGIVGLTLGWLAGLGLNVLALDYLEANDVPLRGTFFVIPPWLILLALGFALLVGILAGLYPAARAARLDPIAALRHE
ncbi:MAG TPA: ABC transporter permease [Herpetosiphonaceae bacterium]|nr:ABC transporter permease [Herpetosiphonaceae bacterium]